MEALPATTLQLFIATTRVKELPKGQIVFYEGDNPHEVYIIKRGVVKVHDISDQGDEKILHILKQGAILPLAFFSGNDNPTRWFYTTLTDCEFYAATKNDLQDFIIKHPTTAIALMNWFSNEVHELLVRLSSLGKTNTRDKLMAALTFLVVCHSKPNQGAWRRVEFPVTHQLLADMIGVTRESTAVCMKQLQKEGLIRYPQLTTLDIHFEKMTREQ